MIHVHMQRGFTLTELLVALVLLAILAGSATSGWQDLINYSHRTTILNRLAGAFHLARTTAITRGLLVTLCPLDQSRRCSKDWSLPLAVFVDRKNQRRLVNAADLIQQIAPPDHGQLVAKPSQKRYFQFEPSGVAHGTIGHVSYCPNNGNLNYAGELVLSRVGRLRRAKNDTQTEGTLAADCSSPN